MRTRSILLWILLIFGVSSCRAAQAGPVPPAAQTGQPTVPATLSLTPEDTAATPTLTASPVEPIIPLEGKAQTDTPVTGISPTAIAATPTALTTFTPDEWQELPIIPEISETTRSIYLRGLELGNNPQAFSKLGDCGSTPAWFLGDFDRGPKYYRLGEYHELMPVIEAFQGSYSRTSLAAKSGFNASSVFTTLWTDRSVCEVNETPIACEYRLNRPIAAFITLGTNDVFHQESFEPQMRKIIEFSIERGVIPILATKADNVEKDGSINATIASLAREYGVPLWNFWRAVQSLPDQGLQDDGVHLTWGPNRFDDPQVMYTAWAMRNLTALQTLDAVWRYVTVQPTAQP